VSSWGLKTSKDCRTQDAETTSVVLPTPCINPAAVARRLEAGGHFHPQATGGPRGHMEHGPPLPKPHVTAMQLSKAVFGMSEMGF